MIKPHNTNSEFELGGINHVALVCSDMARTVDFYSNILGMSLIIASCDTLIISASRFR